MFILLDSNILIYSANPASPFYSECVKGMSVIRQNGDTPCIVPQSLYEFWTVATRPVDRKGLGLMPVQAHRELATIKTLFPFFPDSAAIYPEWERLVTQYSVSGRTAHDARYIAAMTVHGITHLLTYNKDDFKRFSSITPLLPSEI
ncbi:MAG: type II toxin-antitoxin system VapC family toxin [Acidobacteria bacterium]|nr:type II toxin-antitoxin system VapC family toxin [Acidobacteriota bacterium]